MLGTALAVIHQGAALAQVLYSQPTPAYMNVWSYAGQQMADDFTLASSATLDIVRWQGGYCCWGSNSPTRNTGTTESFTVNLYTDAGGLPSGASIYSFTGNATVALSPNPILTNDGPDLGYEYSLDVSNVALSAGTRYWISIYTNDFPESFTWANSVEGSLGRAYFYNGTWNGTFGEQAFTLEGVQVSAVPEPETYAMLLAGLGLLGFAARRRKLDRNRHVTDHQEV